ncbi:DUF3068 domain-containing protein [Microtetraspora sp. AC03309]|uniref:DUF3068 domain-containing protein n=1 Tax=Microtetraspora sp. AC03309 TaxID=2779376 RepID=UPI001E2EA3D3|nr:DUF3068 domain-containing protein [Microtetraspora sp. AC03309]MCC5579829.1 DUF3068 domain-containing protein [Microtetraspora sp. AC03309]
MTGFMNRTSARRALALVLVGAGGFLLTLVPLLRGYVYDQVVRTPLERTSVSRMYAKSATFFDPATERMRTGPIVLTRTLTGDAKAGDDDTAVWIEFASLTTLEGDRIGYHERRAAFDRRTGVIVNCCGEYVDGDTAARQSGLAFRWPLGAGKQDYEYYDVEARRALPITFDGTETLNGTLTYRYKQRTLPVKIEDVATPLPGRLLGLPARAAVPVTRWSRTERTIWVEPVSGVPVKAEENLRHTFRTADGTERLVALQADLRTPREELADNLAEAEEFSSWTTWIRTVLPITGIVLGIVLVGAGLWLSRSAPAEHQEQVPGHDLADAR